jgi:hypothetical protein
VAGIGVLRAAGERAQVGCHGDAARAHLGSAVRTCAGSGVSAARCSGPELAGHPGRRDFARCSATAADSPRGSDFSASDPFRRSARRVRPTRCRQSRRAPHGPTAVPGAPGSEHSCSSRSCGWTRTPRPRPKARRPTPRRRWCGCCGASWRCGSADGADGAGVGARGTARRGAAGCRELGGLRARG